MAVGAGRWVARVVAVGVGAAGLPALGVPAPAVTPLAPAAAQVSGGGYADAVLSDGPLAYWRLGDGPSETEASDELDGHHGTYTASVQRGAAGAVPGDSAARFGDSVSHVQVQNHLTLVPNPAFSLEAWVRADGPPPVGSSWFLYQFYARGHGLQVDSAGRPGGVVYLSTGPSSYEPFTVTSSESVIDGEWHHLVFTREGSVLSIYVDGLLAGETAVSE